VAVAALDADRRFVGQRAAAGAVIFFEFFSLDGAR